MKYIRHEEIFDRPYRYRKQVSHKTKDMVSYFTTDDGRKAEVGITYMDFPSEARVSFTVGGTTSRTGMGDAFRIYATVLKIMAEYMDIFIDVPKLSFISVSVGGEGNPRGSLYKKLAEKYAVGYRVKINEIGLGDLEFELTRK